MYDTLKISLLPTSPPPPPPLPPSPLPLSSPLFHPSKEFELEITELKKHIAQCQLKGKQLKDSCHYDDHTWVDARLDELNMG